ncbi:MAG: 3-deoxy-manno-octulosonate cytidylyltransferase [Alphaproteobacteria bacterium]|nr:3-deoxy-manno-octulosonate cytidylyltransferase [Alphaproteobacteria bacterium]
MRKFIIIPARYASTRLPGKPLAKIAGHTMLERVISVAYQAIQGITDWTIAVATEDDRIMDYCLGIDVQCLMTSDKCRTGSDRVLEAAKMLKAQPEDIVFSLQGDAPFVPPVILQKVLAEFEENEDARVVTPVVNLTWKQLDGLRAQKLETPFSGTTAVVDKDNRALWFSKNIMPAMRNEKRLREQMEHTPILQHLGLYGYKFSTLQEFHRLPEGVYERLEGLEQLRFIENGIPIHAVLLESSLDRAQSGIDSPEDIIRAEGVIDKYGDPFVPLPKLLGK